MPAVNWLSQTDVENYFSRVVIRFFLAVEIPLKHSILCNKYIACVASVSVGFPRKFRCFGRAKIKARPKKERGGG